MCQRLMVLTSIVILLVLVGNVSAELVLHLPCESATHPIDASANPTSVTVNGSLNSVDAQIDKGLEFDGNAANRLQITHASKLEGMSALSIAAWVLPRNSASYEGMCIISKRNAYEDGDSYNLFVWTNQLLNGRINGNNTNIGLSTEPLEDDTWYHLTLIFDSQGATGGKIRLYINGELESSDDHPASAVGTGGAPVWIGELDANRGFAWDGIMDEIRVYDHALSDVEILSAMEGKPWPYAFNPDPADGALHENTWITLSWSPGQLAVSHDVYMGDDFDAVNAATRDSDVYQGNQNDTFYVAGFPGFAFPEGLKPGMTYYWRIDEVNEANSESPWKGDVWSFSIPPKTAYDPDPADGDGVADSSSVILRWTPGFGAKLHTVYFGDDYDEVDNATVGVPAGMTSYSPGQLERERVYYWRVDEFDGLGTYKGDVWTFTTPGAVGNPQPANGAADVAMATILSWMSADSAASHQIYLGTDRTSVRNADTGAPEYQGSVTLGAESYDPGLLDAGTTYYWRVDEVDAQGNTVKGPIWVFTTGAFILVDDFESYTDDDTAGQAIWQTWIDGYGVSDNGAQVGYLLPPYAEQTIVHGGGQSMPLLYVNDAGVANSEATMTLTISRDWTQAGVGELSLWFRGDSGNAAEPLYVAVSNSTGSAAVVANDDPSAATIRSWTQWRVPLQSIADQGINLANVDKIGIGLGTKAGVASSGGSGTIYIDDIRLYQP
ncbi:MAG: LamG domain-containing protein [Sedimentisphaerales bacterium]|nr:LamG domain-containing protein [Sedimentisphaerales bacterium]